MKQHIHELIQQIESRILELNGDTIIIEYEKTRWTSEVKEIDQTFINGYSGVLSVLGIVSEVKKFQNIPGCAVHINAAGFHLGAPLCEQFSRFLDAPIPSYLIDRAHNPGVLDVYGGLAGNMIGQITCGNTTLKSSVLELISGYQKADLPNGFAHGKLGIIYCLTLVANVTRDKHLFKTIKDFVFSEIHQLLPVDVNNINLACCAGEVPLVFICPLVERVFCVSGQYATTPVIIMDCLERHLNFGLHLGAPLHICCGIAGIIDVLLAAYHLTGTEEYLNLAWRLAHRYFHPEGFSSVFSTGILHGLSGICYEFFRLQSVGTLSKTLPSFFFPIFEKTNIHEKQNLFE